MTVRSKCGTCGEPIRRSQLTGRWVHIEADPHISRGRAHEPGPEVINGYFDVETGHPDDAT